MPVVTAVTVSPQRIPITSRFIAQVEGSHQVEIVADRGVGRLVQPAEWQAVCDTMTGQLKQGAYRDSTIAALKQLNTLLAGKLPATGDRLNQLSDKPIIL